ncbi:MAG: protein phosphatase 2C domain-containing protein [Thermoanaerobaculia bacterium]
MKQSLDTPSEGSWLFAAADVTETVSLGASGGEVAVLTRVSPSSGGENEDGAVVVAVAPDRALLAVADGFGGGPAGERASQLAISEIAASAERARTDGTTLRAAILDGFESANRRILELGIGAATTLTAVGIEEGLLRPFHAGDSTILLVGGRGKVKWESVPHSPAGYALASGWVAESEARAHDEAQVVSNYLGSSEMRIEIGPELRLAPRDTVLLASDGLTDNLSLAEVSQTLTRGPSLAASVSALARLARRRMNLPTGKPDDLTLVAFRPRPRI